MDFYEIMQKAIDDATAETGITEPERIFIDGVPFEKGEYLKLRHSESIMKDFDLVLNLKRKGLAIAEELLPKSFNGYPVRYIFEFRSAGFGHEDSFNVRTCVSILSNRTRKSTAFNERRSYSLVFAKGHDGSVNKDFYEFLETEFRMIFEHLLHAACRSANEYWRVENEKASVFLGGNKG
jgi:hypothetical protein